jgi:iron complex transport system ATP-binding protein
MSDADGVSFLSARSVVFQRGKRTVLAGVSLSFRSGEVVALLGRNGAGKTTLLRLMLGLARPHGGEVTLDGVPLSRYSRREFAQRLAYVPQMHRAHFPYRVRDVVSLGRMPALGPVGRMTEDDRIRVEETLRRLAIAHLAERPYTELSCGERQLTIVARALAQGSKLLIMDEPLTGLDYGHQVRLMEQIRRLADEGYGILMTTHDPDRALATATRVATLIDGTIADDGRPEDVLTAETIFRLYGVRCGTLPLVTPRTARR